MSSINRRGFLGHTAATIVSFSAAQNLVPRKARADEANDTIVIAMIGLGGRGRSHAFALAQRDDVEIAYLCDPDPVGRIGGLPEKIAGFQKRTPKAVSDLRTVYDDPEVDGVIISTCDHWHALATIWACQAGKDVYVEKPPAHTLWEGRKMVDAARKYDRVVQVGTQNRSAEYVYAAREFIASGELGEVPLVRVHNLKMGGPYKLPKNSEIPKDVDYDLYLGPAPMRPFNQGHFHGGWLKFWEYCGGDMSDDGVHQIDIARWLLGDLPYPNAVTCKASNSAFKDDRTVPDTLSAIIEYDDHIMTFDMTEYANYMKKTSEEIRNSDNFPNWPQNATRIELYGTKNLMYLGRQGGGWQVMDVNGKAIAQMYGRHTTPGHHGNFLDCIRSRKRPTADIEIGHQSNVVCHLGAIAAQLGGRRVVYDGPNEAIIGDPEAQALLKREYREPYAVPEKV
jgi:predicted dehydrogenase